MAVESEEMRRILQNSKQIIRVTILNDIQHQSKDLYYRHPAVAYNLHDYGRKYVGG